MVKYVFPGTKNCYNAVRCFHLTKERKILKNDQRNAMFYKSALFLALMRLFFCFSVSFMSVNLSLFSD